MNSSSVLAFRHHGARDGFEVVFLDEHHLEGTTTAVEQGESWVVSYVITFDAQFRTTDILQPHNRTICLGADYNFAEFLFRNQTALGSDSVPNGCCSLGKIRYVRPFYSWPRFHDPLRRVWRNHARAHY